MCLSCGCGQVNDDQGDQRNITLDDVRAAAQAANTDERTVAQNIQQGINQTQGRSGWQQSQMSGQGTSYGGQPGQRFGSGTPGSVYGDQPGQGYGSQRGSMSDTSPDTQGYDQPDYGRSSQQSDF
jgi:hypothetical protein